MKVLRQSADLTGGHVSNLPAGVVIMDFSVPEEVDDILERLPERVALRVPNDVLEIWFSYKARRGIVEERALNAARVYAASCGCSFSYDGAGQEGLFLKSCNPAADN